MSASRLFQIINILMDKKSVTASELSKRLEVSIRTIYRDIDALTIAGIPVYATQGKGGGIALLDSYVLRRSLLSKEEQSNILLALKSVSASADVDDLIMKLSGMFQKEDTEWLEIDFTRWGIKQGDNEKFTVLKQAILHHHVIEFMYCSSYRDQQIRKVKPCKLVYKTRNWYLQAFCVDKQAYRTFKLNRIRQIEVGNEVFQEVLIPPPLDGLTTVDERYPTIVLKFPNSFAFRLYDEFEESDVTMDEEGNFIIRVAFPEDSWLYGYLLSFGSGMEILEPAHIKQRIAEEAKKIFEKNK